MSLNIHNISPEKLIKGEGAWSKAIEIIPTICKRPLIIGRSDSTRSIRKSLFNDLVDLGLNPIIHELKHDCCDLDVLKGSQASKYNSCDGIIAAGGGKVLDAGKLIAQLASINCITVPLSASTCAGWTALSNIYSTDGKFIRDISLKRSPDLLIFDHNIVRNAPPRTLASGIADAVAKWYESALTSHSSKDGFVQQAVQMARVLRDQLFLNGHEAFKNPFSESWITVAEGCALTAGIIGGIGGSRCRTAAAHPIHNGLTQLKYTKKPLHGELVGFGTVLQLHLEEENSECQLPQQAKGQLISFLTKLNIPISIDSIGLKNTSSKELKKACKFACKHDSDIHQIPFPINEEKMLKAFESFQSLNINTNLTTRKN